MILVRDIFFLPDTAQVSLGMDSHSHTEGTHKHTPSEEQVGSSALTIQHNWRVACSGGRLFIKKK